ncbi:hypothetical protein [Streptomyces sp. NPDC005760]|uniref:hypothetical protein n=1 Tax=Streptomyces sp. NPDC005760 TaxID=3156718 RepID=UPI0033C40F34
MRAAIGVGLVFVVSGCGHDSRAAKPSAGATGTAAAAKVGVSAGKAALTRTQLESAAIEKDDVPGWEVTVPKSAAGPVGGARTVADKAVCQPVADALSQSGAVKAVAAVERSAVAEDRSGVMVRVRLASYADGDADKVMARLADAALQCKGFNGSGGGGEQRVGVAQYNGYLRADNTVTLRLTTEIGNHTLPVYLDVGSVGSTVEYFATFNVTGDDPGTGSTTAERMQHVKVGAATP